MNWIVRSLLGNIIIGATCGLAACVTGGQGRHVAIQPRMTNGALTCSFCPIADGIAVVTWRYRNTSLEDVWVPVRFEVADRRSRFGTLPYTFLVPGGRLMGVSAMFERVPGTLGMEEGIALAELARVAPGGDVSGKINVHQPFTLDELHDLGYTFRPNPFTPWRSGKGEWAEKEVSEHRITSFQMAIQVYHLPVGLCSYYKGKYDDVHPVDEGGLVVDWNPPSDVIGHLDVSGRYWAWTVTRLENRSPRIDDCCDWCVSPVYEVNWTVGSHPPVGFKE